MIPQQNRLYRRIAAKAFIFVLCSVNTIKAESDSDISLDRLLAIAANRPPIPDNLSGRDSRRKAIQLLGSRATTSIDDETRIVATLGQILADKDCGVSRQVSAVDFSNHCIEAAEALGRRGHIQFVPQFFAMMDCEPSLFLAFWSARRLNQGDAPPKELLQKGLRSPLESTRRHILSVIVDFEMTVMRTDVEKLVADDPERSVRSLAAMALRKIGDSRSAHVLLRAVEKDNGNIAAFEALAVVGNDAQVPALLALLNRSAGAIRDSVLKTLAQMPVTRPQPLSGVFLRELQQNPERPSLYAAAGLARFHDRRALPFLRKIVETNLQEDYEKGRMCARAIADAGGPDAVALLHEMVVSGWRRRHGEAEEALARLGDPSSARIVWPIYEKNPMRMVVSGWCGQIVGYKPALKVLAACADKELLESIRARAALATDDEKGALQRVIAKIEQRLSGIPASAPF
jgi:hypothetical protein